MKETTARSGYRTVSRRRTESAAVPPCGLAGGGTDDIARLATVLDHSWQAKKQTASGISTGAIEKLYDAAMAAGALAGKVSGAGGGGFMMSSCRPRKG